MLKSHTNKWVTHKLEGIYTPQRVSHRSESSEPPVRLSPGVQHQVDEPPEHLALRARRPPGLRQTEASLLRGCKQSFTQEQLFSQTHHASSTQAQNRHWVLRSPLLLLSWYCSPKRQPFSWLLIACFTLKHNFTWINSNSLCIQLTNNANLKTCSIYNV